LKFYLKRAVFFYDSFISRYSADVNRLGWVWRMGFRVSWWFHLKWNPYPSGFHGDVKRQYRCSVKPIENYRQDISGLLLDWIDIHVEVPLVDFKCLTSDVVTGESSKTVRQRVSTASSMQIAKRISEKKPDQDRAGQRRKDRTA